MDLNERSDQQENVYSERIKAGKRRTYFFDVKATKNNDYFVTITESRRKTNGEGFEKSKIYIYKEDFNKFLSNFEKTINYVKTELMPNFDFDSFNHLDDEKGADEI